MQGHARAYDSRSVARQSQYGKGKSVETIGESEIWSFLDGKSHALRLTCSQIRRDAGHRVRSYLELATKVAELNFRNREHVLMFRGQSGDYRNRSKNTTIKPSLFRPRAGSAANPNQGTLQARFAKLLQAERRLVTGYVGKGFLGRERLMRHRILRWSIIQHYEICRTPLLDVSQSLRVAASFASMSNAKEAYIYVLGIPNVSGGVTASAEANIQAIKLASVCPPIAVRPHVQEGYLLGEYPEMANFEQKQMYGHYEIDFGRRLVAKFRFAPKTFWKSDDFPRVTENALYPNASDPLYTLAQRIRNAIGGCE